MRPARCRAEAGPVFVLAKPARLRVFVPRWAWRTPPLPGAAAHRLPSVAVSADRVQKARVPVSELDNPFWASLRSRHAVLAASVDGAARYPAEYAPFLGLERAGIDVAEALPALVGRGESVYLLGVAPARVPPGWRLEAFAPLAQRVCGRPLDVPDGPAAIALGETHRADVLALTARVYPHYFRERTMDLGRYFGIYEDGCLAAMIGERLGTADCREISAVCTHPDFSGRGYARRLLALLTNDLLAAGHTPFLHVSHANTRADRLYERIGYALRRDIGFWALHRE